jgi:hypothetical protein
MKKGIRRFLSVFLTLAFVMGAFPAPLSGLNEAYAAEITEQSAYMKYETNYSLQGLDGSYGSYRLWGYVNSAWKQTTYNEEGFRITLLIDGQSYSVGVAQNGVPKQVTGDLWVTENLSIVNNGRYVKVQFVVENRGSSLQTISLGSGADVQIGQNDTAPITQFEDGSGFYMSEDLADSSSAQFNFIGRDAYGVTNVDTFWYGGYYAVNNNMFTQVSTSSLIGEDSGMAFSWLNRSIGAGSSQAFSVLIGIGALNSPPVTTIEGSGVPLPEGVPGGTYTISGTISDSENSTGTGIYYAIDERPPVNAYTFPGAPGPFTATINIPADITPGSHTLSIFAQDVDGAISSAVTRDFSIPDRSIALTPHNLTYPVGQGAKYIDPDLTAACGVPITGGKVYIEQNFDNSKDYLTFTNMNGVTGSYNTSTGVLTMTGNTTAANYQSFIRNIMFNTSALAGTRKIIVSLTTDDGSVLYFSGTGHYYEYVAANGISWAAARDAAESKAYEGQTGYLATIRSVEENSFVASKCAGDGWLGATDEGHDKEWYWVTGPEAGNKFCQQTPGGAGVVYTVQDWYQNFASGEPNDYPSGTANAENYLHMYSASGTWNDYDGNNTSIKGYLVEYGNAPLAPSGSVASIDVALTDSVPPSVSIAGNVSDWTSNDVILTISASDDASGLNPDGAYSFNGGPWTSSNTQSFSANQTVNIRVRDYQGNITSQDVVIDKIDRSAPVFTGITQAPEGWTYDGVTLTVNGASDAGAGLSEAAYSFSTAEGEYNWQASNTSGTFSQNQTVYVYVRDKLGNISTASIINISNIDNTFPNTPVITNMASYTPDKWYGDSQTVTAGFTPTSGSLETLEYCLDSGQWVNGPSAVISQQGVHYIRFRVVDGLGRTSGETGCIVQIDKTSPQAAVNDTDSSWRNSDFNVTLAFSDLGGSGVNSREYALSDTSSSPGSWLAAGASQIVSITEEGQWYIHYRTADGAGNSVTGCSGPYKLDKTCPTGSVSIRPGATKDGCDYTTIRAITLDITGSDSTSSISGIRIANSSEDLNTASWEGLTSVKENYNLSDGNGLKTIYLQLKDNAGNLSQVYTDTIYFDNVKPAVSVSGPSQGTAGEGDVITYTISILDNSANFGNAEAALNGGIDTISLGSGSILLTASGTVNLGDIGVTVEEISGKPLKRLVKLSLSNSLKAEGTVSLKIAQGAAQDKAGNISDEAACGTSLIIDNVAPANQDTLFTQDFRLKGGSVITLPASSVLSGGLVSDSNTGSGKLYRSSCGCSRHNMGKRRFHEY